MNKNSKKTQKLWGSAFEKSPNQAVISFTAGRDVTGTQPVDYKLLPYDLWGSKAHCIMLCKQGIIELKDAKKILEGLSRIKQLADKNKFPLDPQKEDVHTNVESFLTDLYGIDIAGKLHTARSRNDQCNLDTRLYLKDQAINFFTQINELVTCLIHLSKKYKETPMPGFTHHQHAMVTTFGHVLLAFATMLSRDSERFMHWIELHNTNPLGNAASYGTSFPIDQQLTTSLLGFDGVDINSADYITNRWEPEADLAFAITVFMNHLSLIAETLILFSMPEFDMLKLSDEYSTGSSMMPQKKNPDPLEVIKGKAGFASGTLQSLLSMGKGSFIGFNRDSQWTKYCIADLIDECLPAPSVVKGIFETITVNKEKMQYLATKGFIGATTLLEQIVSAYHIPFRKGKILVEKAVKYSKGEEYITFDALKKSLKEEELDLAITKEQVVQWQNPSYILSITNSLGSPGIKTIEKSISALEKKLKKLSSNMEEKIKQREHAKILLKKEIQNILKGGDLHE